MTDNLLKPGFIMFAIAPLVGALLLYVNGGGLIGSTVSLFYVLGGVVPFYFFIFIAWILLKPKTIQQLNKIVLFSPIGTAVIYLVLVLLLCLFLRNFESALSLSVATIFIVPIGYMFVLLYFLLLSKRSPH